jgi:hypothetical protein
MKANGGVDVWIYKLFTSTLVGVDWSASRSGHFTPGTHWIGGWVGHGTALEYVENR